MVGAFSEQGVMEGRNSGVFATEIDPLAYSVVVFLQNQEYMWLVCASAAI